MKNKNSFSISLTLVAASFIVTVFSSSALADRQRFVDIARVTKVTPIYRTIAHKIPQQQCWVETVRVERPQYRTSSQTSTLLGGVIGGAIGNAVGRGRDNKRIGTVVGSVLGMSIGSDVARRNKHSQTVAYEDVERCETSYKNKTEQVLSGYDVSYVYKSEHFNTHTKRHPGKRLKVAVNVTPIEEY